MHARIQGISSGERGGGGGPGPSATSSVKEIRSSTKFTILFKENYYFQDSRGVQYFPGGVQLFPRAGGGVQV